MSNWLRRKSKATQGGMRESPPSESNCQTGSPSMERSCAFEVGPGPEAKAMHPVARQRELCDDAGCRSGGKEADGAALAYLPGIGTPRRTRTNAASFGPRQKPGSALSMLQFDREGVPSL
jgi:hypothetical protein